MDSWRTHMPEGMMLKSDGFASNLSDPDGRMTLKEFCEERGIPYSDNGLPVSLETFAAYGLAFKDRLVPELENKMVTTIEHLGDGYELTLSDGEQVRSRRVILAVGITHFAHVPACLEHLPEEFLTHSFQHRRVDTHRGRRVVVVGGGASAIGLAGLMRSAGVDSQLLVRDLELKFHTAAGKQRSLWQMLRHPKSGLGPGIRSRFCANSPEWFHRLPEKLRIEAVRRHLGPSGHWVSKDNVMGKVPLMLGCRPEGAEVRNGKVILQVRQADGTRRDIEADHVIAGTGYRVQMERLRFLKPELIAKIRTAGNSPDLSNKFESSLPGLYFVGLTAANSFGPVMRFAYGAEFAARNLTRAITKAATLGRAISPAERRVKVEKMSQVEEMSR
jgi:hypothetical protein